jgi:hypothetical protein
LLSDVAKRLGISQENLVDAIKDTTIAGIDGAVAAGDITKGGRATRPESVSSPATCRHPEELRRPGGLGPLHPDGAFAGRFAGPDLLETDRRLPRRDRRRSREALRDGNSLANLATNKSKSVDGLKKALLTTG